LLLLLLLLLFLRLDGKAVSLYLRRRRSAVFAPKAQPLFPFPFQAYPSTSVRVLFRISYIVRFSKKATGIDQGGTRVVTLHVPVEINHAFINEDEDKSSG
jgi:hypothetical protein